MGQALNDGNFGPVTLFRVYPDGVDPEQAFRREIQDPAYREQLKAHNAYNRRIFDLTHDRAMQGQGVLLSWTDAYRHAAYGGEEAPPIAPLKSFILSPWTDLAAVELVARQVLEARTGRKKIKDSPRRHQGHQGAPRKQIGLSG
jgi:hypothetical protein